MPRNGAGVASPVPGFNTVAASTTILSALHNSGINDIFTILNSAWPVSLGGTGGTTSITSWDAITAKGTDIASASTIVLTTATGPRIDITGTTAITAVTLANGSTRIARATGIFVLTASASLIVNKSTSVNYTTTVGDLMIFTAEGGVTSVTTLGIPSDTINLARAGGFNNYTALQITANDTASLSATNGFINIWRNRNGNGTLLGEIQMDGDVSTGGRKTYGRLRAEIVDHTSASEDGKFVFTTPINGTDRDVLSIGGGLWSRTLSDMGEGTINFGAYYKGSSYGVVTLDSPTAASSGTAVSRTGVLPSGAKAIDITFANLSTSGVSPIILQLGVAGVYTTSGYTGGAGQSNGGIATQTAGFPINNVSLAAGVYSGILFLRLLDSSTNRWVASGSLINFSGTSSFVLGGQVSLSGVVDSYRFTTVGGADTFDSTGTLPEIGAMWW